MKTNAKCEFDGQVFHFVDWTDPIENIGIEIVCPHYYLQWRDKYGPQPSRTFYAESHPDKIKCMIHTMAQLTMDYLCCDCLEIYGK